MAWQNNNGGNQGPWGQRPGGGGQQPPNLDDIIRKGQERFKGFGGEGGSKKPIVYGLIALVALWLGTGFYKVLPDEAGVVLRFGQWVKTTEPGLHYHLPYPIETVEIPKVTTVNKIDVGMGMNQKERQMLTGDENIVDVQYSVLWQIKDPAYFLFNVEEPNQTIKSVSESAMREVIARNKIQDIMTSERRVIEVEVKEIMQRVLDRYQAGVDVRQVKLDTVSPPTEVAESFNDVQKAEADRDKLINEAKRDQNKIVPRARGQAEQMKQQAMAYREQVIANAQGESTRFLSVYNEYKQAKDVTRSRIYLETMEKVLGGTDKVIMQNSEGSGIVPYLPLPELKNKNKQ